MSTRLLSIVIWLALVPAALAAPRVSVNPVASTVYVGQTLTLRYALSDAPNAAIPPELNIPGCTVRYAGMSQSSRSFTRIVNGKQRSTQSATFEYAYNIKPARPGRFDIPPMVFELQDGTRLTSPRASLTAQTAPESPSFFVTVETDADRVYVGQPVTVTWSWYAAQRIAGAEITWPAPENAEVLVTDESDPANKRGAAVTPMMGVDTALGRDRRRHDGEVWEVYSASLVVIPHRAGTLTIPASTVLIDADTGRRRRGMSVFDTSPVTETVSAASSPLEIPVAELPAQGRPAGFTGLVGRYTIQTSASPTRVRVGDPIALRLAVRGPEPLRSIPEPELASLDGFAGSFRIDGDEDEPQRTRRGVIFHRTLRAQHDGVVNIPAVELPYFDPELGRYDVARSEPIPLEVAPTRIVTLADAQGGAEDAPTGGTIESRTGGLAANVTDLSALTPERFDLGTLTSSPGSLALLAFPPGIAAAAGALALARTRSTKTKDRTRRRRAAPAARAALGSAQTPEDITAALRGYFAARWPETPAELTADDVRRVLHDDALADEITAILDACDAARFGSGPADTATLVERATQAIGTLDAENDS